MSGQAEVSRAGTDDQHSEGLIEVFDVAEQRGPKKRRLVNGDSAAYMSEEFLEL
jgi:hypothetical protein